MITVIRLITDFQQLESIHDYTGVSITGLKNIYCSRLSRIFNVKISAKSYWSNLKIFPKSEKKLCFPPIFHQNKLITNFKEKVGKVFFFLRFQRLLYKLQQDGLIFNLK